MRRIRGVSERKGAGFEYHQQFQIWAASRDPWWMRRAQPTYRVLDTERRALSTLQQRRFRRVDKRSASTICPADGSLPVAPPKFGTAGIPSGLLRKTGQDRKPGTDHGFRSSKKGRTTFPASLNAIQRPGCPRSGCGRTTAAGCRRPHW
jgi:hypothetical protein